MSKYFSKAVFYTERMNRNTAIFAYSFIYLLGIIYYAITLHTTAPGFSGPIHPSKFLNAFHSIFIVIAVIIVMYSYISKSRDYYFMLTQSYSRDSIIITKTISFIISYSIPTIIYGILSLILISTNRGNYDRFSNNLYYLECTDLFLKVLGVIASLTILVLFLQFMQMLFGKMMCGIIFPVIIYILFSLDIAVMGQFISNKLGPLRDYCFYSFHFLLSFSLVTATSQSVKTLPTLILSYLDNSSFAVSFILIIISMVIFFFSLLLNRRIHAEKTSDLFLFKPVETVFKTVFVLFTTLTSSIIFSGILYYLYSLIKGMAFSTYLMNTYGIAGKENIEHTIYLVLNILWIPLFAFIYKRVSKIMNAGRLF